MTTAKQLFIVLMTTGMAAPTTWSQPKPPTTRPAEAVVDPSTQQSTIWSRYDNPGAIEEDLAEYTKALPTLSVDEAASRWLTFVDRIIRQRQARANGDFSQLNAHLYAKAIEQLPPPSAWDALARQVAARPVNTKQPREEAALRATVALLVGDTKTASAQLPNLRKRPKAEHNEYWYNNPSEFDALTSFLNVRETNKDDIEKTITAKIDSANKSKSYEHGSVDSLELPDLITLLGKEKATELLTKALATPAEVEIEVGDATRKLAQELALTAVDSMVVPQWKLVDTRTLDLYEAILKRFPTGKRSKPGGGMARWLGLAPKRFDSPWELSSFREAKLHYMLGLIIADRTADATVVAKSLGKDLEDHDAYSVSLDELTKAGHGPAVRKFLHALLKENPDLKFWKQYTELAASTGASDEMLQLARDAAARPNVPDAQRLHIQNDLLTALLAADAVDEAVTLMRTMLAAPEPKPKAEIVDGDITAHVASLDIDNGKLPIATKLAKVGNALDRKDLFEEGITATKRELAASAKKTADGSSEWSANEARTELAELLINAGRGAEAIELLKAALPKPKGVADAANARPWDDQPTTHAMRLTELACAYSKLDMDKEVLDLLNDSRYWNATDLVELYEKGWCDEIPFGYVAAKALAAAGRKDEAKHVIDAVLDASGGHDPAYALRVSIGGDDLIPKLDSLYARDAFEERPLIWKAIVQLKAGKLDEAEATAKAAVAIDPSDGEQGKGDRMRVYAVLADIADAKGHANDAKFLRGVVEAIRISERADTIHEAGLVKRATDLYQEALTKFADAYCIQSRLARQYAEMGMTELAAKHYKRAFELMPDSFGRMESHCFGCEGAFKGPTAQQLAEQIFSDMLAKNPEKPQLHYLLGYLRQEQGRYDEAAKLFREAVRLDPLYLNAWKHLVSVGQHIQLPVTDRDAAILTMLKLDPLQRHVQPDLDDVHDFRALWTAVESANKLVPPKPDQLLVLTASKRQIEQGNVAKTDDDSSYRSMYGNATPGQPPAQTLIRHRALRPLIQVIDGF